MGRSRLCFCASSYTLVPPDLCSAGDSLFHSLREGRVDLDLAQLEPFKGEFKIFSHSVYCHNNKIGILGIADREVILPLQ